MIGEWMNKELCRMLGGLRDNTTVFNMFKGLSQQQQQPQKIRCITGIF
jgi:hypothetical protein